MKNIDQVRKLNSHKLCTAVESFAYLLFVALGYLDSEAVQVTSLIMAGATVVSYNINEGLVDSASVGSKEENK